MRRFALLSALAAVFVLVPATAFAQQAETPRLEQIVPDHTFLTVSLNDLGAARTQFSRTALAKLWREEEVQQLPNVEVWLESTAVGVFADQKIGVVTPEGYKVVECEALLVGRIRIDLGDD